MLLKKKIVSNGTRHQLNIKKFLLCKNTKVIKALLKGKNKLYGRGLSLGRITMRHRGGGCKSLYRKLLFSKQLNYSIVITHTYDPLRTSFLVLCFNFLTKKFYNTISTNFTYPGTLVSHFLTYPELRLGIFSSVKNIPIGSLVHSLIYKDKVQYAKSAGVYAILLQVEKNFCKIKLPSGVIKKFFSDIQCIIGTVSNTLHNSTVLGKAGRARLKGRRPYVRGVAMNPVDHPHGGQTSGGIPSVTPWGIPTKGKPTRKKNK